MLIRDGRLEQNGSKGGRLIGGGSAYLRGALNRRFTVISKNVTNLRTQTENETRDRPLALHASGSLDKRSTDSV